MQLGELVFSLGFQNKSGGAVKEFESGIDSSQKVVSVLADAIDHLTYLIEQMAIKMGAVTRADIDANKKLMAEKKAIDDTTTATDKNVVAKNKTSGIISTLNTKMKSYWGNLAAARIQILAVTSALTYFTKKATDVAISIDKITALTGLSSNTVQKLGDMAAQTGGNVNDLAGAVQSFQKQSVDIMLGRGGNIGTFQYLGIDPHEDPIKILEQLSVKLKSMPTALGTSMAKDLGLSDDLIYFLKNTDNIKAAPEETFLTEKELKRLKDFNFYFNRVWEMGKRTMSKFAASITPIVNQVVYFFERMSLMFSGLMTKIEPYMSKLQKWMPLIATLGAILFIAFFPVTAAILLMLAAFEDIYTYVNGGDSVFGSMVEWLKDIKQRLIDVIDLILFLGNQTSLGKLLNAVTGGKFSDATAEWAGKLHETINQFGKENNVDMTGASAYGASKGLGPVTNNNMPTINFNIDGSKDPKAVADEINRLMPDAYWNRTPGELGNAQVRGR